MHVYVHIPFCRRKCIYCDFFSVGERLADWPGLVDSLLREARIRADSFGSHTPGVPSSLYIGGGTPSLMPVEELLRLSGGRMVRCRCESCQHGSAVADGY